MHFEVPQFEHAIPLTKNIPYILSFVRRSIRNINELMTAQKFYLFFKPDDVIIDNVNTTVYGLRHIHLVHMFDDHIFGFEVM